MKRLPAAVAVLAAALALLVGAPVSAADVHVTLQNGRVSIVARDATVRQILAEWARVGQVKMVNVERIAGGPVTLELQNVTEADALDVLLRSIAGFMAAPRVEPVATLSRFDRLVVMPTAVPPRPAPVAAAPVFRPPQTPFLQPQRAADDDTDDEGPQPPVRVPNRAPVFNPYPQPQLVNPQPGAPQEQPQGVVQPGVPTSYPSTPTSPFGGVAVPGMVVPAPPQPGQPGQTAPGQPVRRPDGQ